jgi:hypothetical protein
MNEMFGIVDGMAFRASQLVLPVHAVGHRGQLRMPAMTRSASIIDVFRGRLGKREDLAAVTGIDVGLSWAVARFTLLVFPFAFRQDSQGSMRIPEEFRGQIIVAGSTSGTGGIICLGRRSHVGCGWVLCCVLGLILRISSKRVPVTQRKNCNRKQN